MSRRRLSDAPALRLRYTCATRCDSSLDALLTRADGTPCRRLGTTSVARC